MQIRNVEVVLEGLAQQPRGDWMGLITPVTNRGVNHPCPLCYTCKRRVGERVEWDADYLVFPSGSFNLAFWLTPYVEFDEAVLDDDGRRHFYADRKTLKFNSRWLAFRHRAFPVGLSLFWIRLAVTQGCDLVLTPAVAIHEAKVSEPNVLSYGFKFSSVRRA